MSSVHRPKRVVRKWGSTMRDLKHGKNVWRSCRHKLRYATYDYAIKKALKYTKKYMKAQYVYDHYGVSCFADDTGLEVDALNGAPGVLSARYAGGEGHDSEANMRKLLHELGNNNNRKARFRTVIALILKNNGETAATQQLFEGIVNGEIIREKQGEEGFGYDPLFQPDGYNETFAQLGVGIKNKISHRARATQKLAEYLLNKKEL